MKIPVCEPSTTEVEKRWVNKALDENMISSTGSMVDKFEEELAKRIGTDYCVAVNSGGSALFLTLWALGIRSGDEVIVPDFTMVATANAVMQCEAYPEFVDSEYDTGNIDVNKIEEHINHRTKAIIPVHLYGHPCDMDKIMKIADKYHLKVIEDAAEAHGAEYKGKMVGSIGDVGCFSFYANKNITTGEGGAICTNNKALAEELRELRAYYFSPEKHFDHKKLAWNMRMSSLEAAYGLGQLERFNELIIKRKANANYYSDALDKYVDTPPEKDYADSVYWMYWIKVKQRDELREFLADNGIETRTGFFGMHTQEHLKDGSEYPISDKLAKNSLYLPSASDLTKGQKDYVIEKVKEFYDK